MFLEQKEKLTDVEQQLKKAEAAQRRRMQVEKAARESEVCSLHDIICTMIHSYSYTLFLIGTKPVLNESCRPRRSERYSVKIQAERSGKIK